MDGVDDVVASQGVGAPLISCLVLVCIPAVRHLRFLSQAVRRGAAGTLGVRWLARAAYFSLRLGGLGQERGGARKQRASFAITNRSQTKNCEASFPSVGHFLGGRGGGHDQ